MSLTEFRIGRGHDGPARVGECFFGSESYKTPILTSPYLSENWSIPYGTIGRETSHSSKPCLLALPFETHIDAIEKETIKETDSILLPSLPSFSSLVTNAGFLMLRHQLSVLDELQSLIEPSRFVIRTPEEIEPEVLASNLRDFHSRGVRAAAFTFDGLLGDFDLNSILKRRHLPMSWLTLALGRIAPGSIPLLYYLGFDVIDIGHAQEAAAKHQRLWHNGTETIVSGEQYRYCPCLSCQNLEGDDSSKLVDSLLAHNVNVYITMLSEALNAMKSGRLRWLVESTTHYSPAHASILRKIDREAYSFIEEFTPTTGAAVVPLIGPESYNAPSVRRFREYIASRYNPPPYKKIALLLPCSARKPYSDSKSHRRFLETIEASFGGGATSQIAQIILTSPLGLVPRELERAFPAANYDIPVTGEWDTEETNLAADALVTHLNKFNSDLVIVAHVSGGYLGIVQAAESRISQSIIYTSSQASPTSWESRESLQETLSDLKDIYAIKSFRPQELEEIVRATADFQFGPGAGEALVPEHARLVGKPYRQILCRIEKEQVCSYVADAGLLSLTLAGAKRIAPLNRYWVCLDALSIKGGSIFAVGVKEADPAIRQGDEVIVQNNQGEVIAVGRSEMSGREMCELERGRAVSVRHKLEGD
jgi:archaeosine synthase